MTAYRPAYSRTWQALEDACPHHNAVASVYTDAELVITEYLGDFHLWWVAARNGYDPEAWLIRSGLPDLDAATDAAHRFVDALEASAANTEDTAAHVELCERRQEERHLEELADGLEWFSQMMDRLRESSS